MRRPGDILVVDDEADIVNLVVELLQDEGYEVRSASSGEMALAAIAQRQPAMILMDMYMPRMTGVMLLENLRANGAAHIPVVLMTASPRAAEPLLNQGMVGYLAKPFDIDQLLECVKRYLRGDGEANASSNPSSHTQQV